MPGRLTTLLLSLTLPLFMQGAALAESGQDRVTLMLNGPDCPSLQQTVTAALRQHTGVLRADPDLMPDHLLVDILRAQLTDEALAAAANTALAGTQCRAEIMKSCITAGPPDHGTEKP